MRVLRLPPTLALTVAFALPGIFSAQQPATRTLVAFEGSADIGKTVKGATVPNPADATYRISGGGADMWGAEDAFHLSWVRLSGDATLTADVLFPPGSVPALAKGVLIFRQSLDPASAYADVAIHGDGHITLQYRSVAGGATADATSGDHNSSRIRIERKGDQFTAFSEDAQGKLKAFSTTKVALDGPVYVGLGVCSHNVDTLATATFSHVSLERAATAKTTASLR